MKHERPWAEVPTEIAVPDILETLGRWGELYVYRGRIPTPQGAHEVQLRGVAGGHPLHPQLRMRLLLEARRLAREARDPNSGFRGLADHPCGTYLVMDIDTPWRLVSNREPSNIMRAGSLAHEPSRRAFDRAPTRALPMLQSTDVLPRAVPTESLPNASVRPRRWTMFWVAAMAYLAGLSGFGTMNLVWPGPLEAWSTAVRTMLGL